MSILGLSYVVKGLKLAPLVATLNHDEGRFDLVAVIRGGSAPNEMLVGLILWTPPLPLLGVCFAFTRFTSGLKLQYSWFLFLRYSLK